MDDDLPTAPGCAPAPARLPITDISQWLERYSVIAALLATQFPHKAPELLAYQSTIIRTTRESSGWHTIGSTVGRQYSREVLSRKDLNLQ